jgi:hypothetical protein
MMDIVEHSTDWIAFDAENDEVPFLHMHDMIEVKYINGIDLSSPVPAWSVDFDRSRDPVVAYRVIKKADASEIEQLRELEARYWKFAPKYDGLLIDIEKLRSIIKRADAILAERNDHWSIEGARNALFEGLEETR